MSKPERTFVWVTTPKSSMQHQAELLEIRSDGYLVRWMIRNTTELISLDSTLTTELPSRQRKPSPIKRMNLEQEREEQRQEAKKQKLAASPAKGGPQLQTQGQNGALNNSPLSGNLQQNATIPTESPASNKENNKSASTSKQHQQQKMEPSLDAPKPPHDLFDWVDETTGLAKPNASYGCGEDTDTETEQDSSSKRKHPITGSSLWKIHNLSRSTAEARLSQLLEPYSFSHASKLVANLFLFAYERQCCWQRRNNEGNSTWSESPIFQNYTFANDYRELDRGTCFIRSEFCKLHIRHLHQNKNNETKPVRRRDWIQKLLWASYLYRQSNSLEPFVNFGGIPSTEEVKMFLDYVGRVEQEGEDKEEVFFTRIYPTPSFDEYRFHLNRLLEANCWLLKSVAGRLAQCKTVKECWEQISKRLPGLSREEGRDIAWQVTCDLLEAVCLLCSEEDQEFCHFSSNSLRALSSQLKQEDPVDESTALRLTQVLVKKQDEIFVAIGVKFPKWNGRSLTLKNMEHCLGQYGRFLQITSDLRLQRSGGGHRLMASRSHLDVSKNCRFCNVETDDGIFCDACLCFYCSNCEKESCAAELTTWTCRPCVDLSQMKFQDY